MLRRALAVTVALATVVAGLLARRPSTRRRRERGRVDEPAGAVVLIGTGGIGWSDVDRADHPEPVAAAARRLLGGPVGALGLLQHLPDRRLARAVGRRPRRRAARRRRARPRRPALPERPGRGQRLGAAVAGYLEAAADERFDSRLGLLGDTAAAGRICVKAVQPFAAAGGARRDGRIEQYPPCGRRSRCSRTSTAARSPSSTSGRCGTPTTSPTGETGRRLARGSS